MTKPEKPVLHVVFNMSAAGSLRQALADMGVKQAVIGLPDDLSFGPIDPPTSDLRGQWVEEVLGYDDFGDYGKRADLFWSQATCLGALWDDGTYCGDLVLWSRVRALADESVFEMEGDGVRMRNSFVRLASRAG